MKPPLKRIPGQAVYISHHPDRAPLALHATVEELHELSEKVVLVTVKITDSAHVPEEERAVFDNLRYKDDGISHLTLSYGFHDSPNIPELWPRCAIPARNLILTPMMRPTLSR